jgi:hypothetical protein
MVCCNPQADPVWQLMQRTRNHPRFHHWYNFDSYEKGWVTTGRYAATGPAFLLSLVQHIKIRQHTYHQAQATLCSWCQQGVEGA